MQHGDLAQEPLLQGLSLRPGEPPCKVNVWPNGDGGDLLIALTHHKICKCYQSTGKAHAKALQSLLVQLASAPEMKCA